MHGQFIWYELTTPDIDAAQAFYPRITRWGTQRFDNDYIMWTMGGVPFAGLFHLSDEMRRHGVTPNWMAYVETQDADETVKQARSAGGRVVFGPADITGVARFAVLQDPQGATFGVYQTTAALGAWDGTPVVGRFSWHELMTTDYEAAFAFYRDLFGWEETGRMDMGGGHPYLMFGKDGKGYGGMFNRPADMQSMHPFWLYYIHLKNVGDAVAAATGAGASVHRPQMEIPGGAIAILGDPQGTGFAVHHTTAAGDAV